MKMTEIVDLNLKPASILTAVRGTICKLDDSLFKLIYVHHIDKFCMVQLNPKTMKPLPGAIDNGVHSVYRYLVDATTDNEFMNRSQLYEMVKL